MSRKRAASPSHIDDFDDEFYENNCLNGNYTLKKLIDSRSMKYMNQRLVHGMKSVKET